MTVIKMRFSKVTLSIERETLERLDRLVKDKVFPSRSRAIQEAIREKLARLERTRLAEECSKLDPIAEKAMAEEGLSDTLQQWPEY